MLHSLELKLQVVVSSAVWVLGTESWFSTGEQGLLTAFAVSPALNEGFIEHGDNIVLTFNMTSYTGESRIHNFLESSGYIKQFGYHISKLLC